MSDRLEEIKKRRKDLRVRPQDVDWLIGEVERLRRGILGWEKWYCEKHPPAFLGTFEEVMNRPEGHES